MLPTLSRRRPHAAVRPAALLTSLALLLTACGGGGTDPDAPTGSTGKQQIAASKPGELTAFVQARLRTQNAQGRLTGVLTTTFDGLVPTATAAVVSAGITTAVGAVAAAPVPTNASNTAGADTAQSSTLVQEDGVDEADLIQTDGRFVYTLQSPDAQSLAFTAHERGANTRAVVLKKLDLPTDGAGSVQTDGMVFSADRTALAVISEQRTFAPGGDVCREVCIALAPVWTRSSVNVQRVDVSNPGAASAGERVSIDGSLVDTRRIGDALYVVSQHRPVLGPEVMPATASTAQRDAAISQLSAAELLPSQRRNGGKSEPLLAETDCYLQGDNASSAVQFTIITVFDLRSPTLAHTSRCFLGGSEAVYLSPDNLYVATTRMSYSSAAGGVGSAVSISTAPGGDTASSAAPVYPSGFETDIHKFALAGSTVSYRASGTVDGHLGWDREKKSFRLSEYNGDLRVLTFTGETGWFAVADGNKTPSPAKLTILRERSSDQSLQTVSTLPSAARPAAIGKPGEQVYAVRFVGARAYVVTFRRTDPLYVLDLANPADPHVVAALEVAGFSETLYPLPNNLLLGVGRDADGNGRVTGLMMAVFDLADPTHPTERAILSLGTFGSSSALDTSRHGLNLRIVNQVARVALPVTLARSSYADWQHGLQRLEINTATGTLTNRGLIDDSQSGNASTGTNWGNWQERSVQINDTIYYLASGALSSHAW